MVEENGRMKEGWLCGSGSGVEGGRVQHTAVVEVDYKGVGEENGGWHYIIINGLLPPPPHTHTELYKFISCICKLFYRIFLLLPLLVLFTMLKCFSLLQ